MDNRVFDVNGRTKEQLKATLDLVLNTEYSHNHLVTSWAIDKQHGLILYWSEGEGTRLFIEPGIDALADMVWDWLQTDDAKSINLTEWERDADHDGHNERGFRVYCGGEWGAIEGHQYTICAVKSIFCWYGK